MAIKKIARAALTVRTRMNTGREDGYDKGNRVYKSY